MYARALFWLQLEALGRIQADAGVKLNEATADSSSEMGAVVGDSSSREGRGSVRLPHDC